MAIFPECSFEVLLAGGVFVPGERAEGSLEIVAPRSIAHAEYVKLEFRSRAWAGYRSGKHRKIAQRDMFPVPLRIDLPGDLPAGTHRYPFTVDVPEWLPPGFRARDCAIEHTMITRLDVSWAKDPSATTPCLVVLPPVDGTQRPVATRSPADFHSAIALEVTLASSVLALDEPLVGKVALRSGHAARFDGVDLAFGGVGRSTMAKGDVRPTAYVSKVRIAAEALRSGKAVPFTISPHPSLVPSFQSSFIDHEPILRVSVAVPWLSDPAFDIPLQILPLGSTIGGAASAGDVGNDRLREIAAVMAKGTGLRAGLLPTLVEGELGPVRVRLGDAPRGAELGLHICCAARTRPRSCVRSSTWCSTTSRSPRTFASPITIWASASASPTTIRSACSRSPRSPSGARRRWPPRSDTSPSPPPRARRESPGKRRPRSRRRSSSPRARRCTGSRFACASSPVKSE